MSPVLAPIDRNTCKLLVIFQVSKSEGFLIDNANRKHRAVHYRNYQTANIMHTSLDCGDNIKFYGDPLLMDYHGNSTTTAGSLKSL